MIPLKKAQNQCDGMDEWMEENKYHLMLATATETHLEGKGKTQHKHNNNRMREKIQFEI